VNPASAFGACVCGLLLLGVHAAAAAQQRVTGKQCEPLPAATFMPVRLALQAPAQPSAPSAPPLPFRYIGKLVQDGRAEIWLMRGERHFSVAPGDSLGRDYRVEQVTDTEVLITYLPLNVQQSLPL
jgi:hypothetical protein